MSQNPSSPQTPPDPATSYGREKPEKEAGQGRLDNNMDATPTDGPDRMDHAVENPHHPARQINAQDTPPASSHASRPLNPTPDVREQPDHSLLDEEPRGEDLRPEEAEPDERRRHPRTEGKGGTK